MTLFDLLNRLRAVDVRLSLEGGRLAFNAPPGSLTDDVRGALARFKPVLLGMLAASAPTCPLCQAPANQLGSFVLDDGRGRFACPGGHGAFWAVGPLPTEPPSWSDGWTLTDAEYQDVVDADIAAHGYYRPDRRYPVPTDRRRAAGAR